MSDAIKPVAWMWTQAEWNENDLRGRGWHPQISRLEPMCPWMEKDKTPLYDQATLDAAITAERERCAKVCDEIARQYLATSNRGHSAERAAARIRQPVDNLQQQ